MPGRNGNGPNGNGPLTGRGLGICNGNSVNFGRGRNFRNRGFSSVDSSNVSREEFVDAMKDISEQLESIKAKMPENETKPDNKGE